MATGIIEHDRSTAVGRRLTRLAIAIAALLIAFPTAASAEDVDQPASNITITQTDSSVQEACLPGFLVLTRQIRNTDTYFELIVRASAPPCEPINATAAIYSMPGNGVAWPQRLVETKDFTISKAGTTAIRFTKTCDPVQFDVVTGATPEVISPEGEHHGPLLFPTDTETSLQHWTCAGGTTTTSTTSTTTSTTSTTSTTAPPTTDSTVPPTVSPTSEVPPTAPTTVLGIQQENPENPNGVGNAEVGNNSANGPEVKDSRLAYTGADSRSLSLMGVAILLSGVALIVFSRRRAASA